MTSRLPPPAWIAVTTVLLAALAALTVYLVSGLGYFDTRDAGSFILVTIAMWVLFALAMLTFRKVPPRAALVLVFAGSVMIGGAALAGPPNTSTDSARYAWDGIVQNAGISPYTYVPVDDALSSLRPDWLFTAALERADGTHHCAEARMYVTTTIPSKRVICTAINRSTVPTIYPAAGELYFAAVRFIVGPTAEYWPLQLTGLLLSLGITTMLVIGMRRRGIDLRWAALWAWCPLVATEAVNNSHVDALGVLLVVLATLLVSKGMRFRGGIALGAAIAVKLVPVIAAPALLRRQPWRVIVASIVTFAVLYIPYVIASGLGVIGFLPGYLSEEGYNDGERFALLSIFLPPAAAIPVAILLLAIVAAIVWLKTDPQNPWLGQLVMIGATLLIASPRYPWYALLVVPFIALSGRWEWFAVALALTARQLVPSHSGYQLTLSIAVVVIVALALYRAGPGGRSRLRHPIALVRGSFRAP